MSRWLFAALLFCASLDLAACPLCLGAYQSSKADQLVELSRAVLAVPDQDGRRALARRIVRDGLSVRAAELAARTAGARRKQRRSGPVDTELARRLHEAFLTLTGFEAKLGATGLHVPLEGQVQLEELAEALERLAAPS